MKICATSFRIGLHGVVPACCTVALQRNVRRTCAVEYHIALYHGIATAQAAVRRLPEPATRFPAAWLGCAARLPGSVARRGASSATQLPAARLPDCPARLLACRMLAQLHGMDTRLPAARLGCPAHLPDSVARRGCFDRIYNCQLLGLVAQPGCPVCVCQCVCLFVYLFVCLCAANVIQAPPSRSNNGAMPVCSLNIKGCKAVQVQNTAVCKLLASEEDGSRKLGSI